MMQCSHFLQSRVSSTIITRKTITLIQPACTSRGLKSRTASSTTTALKAVSSSSSPKEDRKQRLIKSKELIKFIEKKAQSFSITVQQFLPLKSFKLTSTIPTTSYLIDKSVASDISSVIQTQNLDLNAPVVELSPGVGILTSQLIRLGFKNITCFEEQAKCTKYIAEQFNVQVIQKGFSDFPRLHHADKIDGGNRIANILSQIKVQKETETPPSDCITYQKKNVEKVKKNKKKNLLVFGSFPHLSLINFTVKSLITQRVLYEEDWNWDDPVYYITLGPKAYWILTSTPTSGFFLYRPSAVLFQLLFKSILLKTVPRQSFIPWVNDSSEGKSKKFKIRNAFQSDIAYFMKIETNWEVVDKLGRDQLLPFWYFVRQHLFSRKNPIIPQLEQWIPGVGARLIRQGFTIYSQFGELTPEQILDLYLQFISWPEFAGSSFLEAVEKYQSRIETQDEDVVEYQKREN